MSSLTNLKARLRDEAGMTLIEVMTSALVLLVVSLGVTKGIDAASNASGISKLKSSASTLAQQDQERLRTLTAANLAKFNSTRTQTVRGVPFTIVSRSRWISDSSGTESCAETGAAGDDEASYMQITSTVTWTDMHGMKPVVATSLVAPPNGSFGEQGSLLIEILDRNGAGVPAIPVTATPLSGTTSAITQTTGDQGCAFFGFLPPINFRVTFDKAGYVDQQGVQAVSKDVGVTAAATNRAGFVYDRASTFNVNVVTRLPGATSDIAAKAEYMTVGHSSLLTPGTRQFGTGASASTFTLSPLFPFASTYSVYSGNCIGANPTNNSATGVFQIAPPGAAASVTVREIAIRFDSGGNRIDSAKLTAKSTGCSGSTTYPVGTDDYMTADKAVPYGLYDICVHRDAGTNRYRNFNNVAVNDPLLGATVDGTPTANGSWIGSCP
jgi:Tfp pilus assembly protein PilV